MSISENILETMGFYFFYYKLWGFMNVQLLQKKNNKKNEYDLNIKSSNGNLIKDLQ